MEWMIIIVSLASPDSPRGGAPYPVVQFERFATEAECTRAGNAIQRLSADLGGSSQGTAFKFSCGQVTPLQPGYR